MYAASTGDGLYGLAGASLAAVEATPRVTFNAVWGDSASSIFAVGPNGIIVRGTTAAD